MDRFLELLQAGEFTKARSELLLIRARRRYRMSSSETRPRRSTRELIARRAPTDAMSKPS